MAAAGGSRQFVTFTLGKEHCAVDILRVREIRGWSPVTRIPQSPPHVLGCINLRGAIIPVVDLRMRFGLDSAAYAETTVIIVLSVEAANGRRELGVVVDGVSDVIDVDAAAIKPPPDLGHAAGAGLIQGLMTLADHMVMLLDVDHLVGGDLGDAMTLPNVANG